MLNVYVLFNEGSYWKWDLSDTYYTKMREPRKQPVLLKGFILALKFMSLYIIRQAEESIWFRTLTL